MPARATFHTRQVIQSANALVEELAKRKEADMHAESKENFNDLTGNLRRSIRVEGNRVAIGNIRLPYWRWVRKKTRGMGIIWIRQAGRYQLEGRLRQSAKAIGLL